MKLSKLFIGIVFCLFPAALLAQEESSVAGKSHHFTMYAGVGPNLYFNNLVLAKDYVHPFNYSFSGRIMWEPGHLLSLGIETGYYQLYSVSDKTHPGVHISNAAIPIQLVVGMKFLKKFYFDFSSGQSILLNNVTAPALGNIHSSTFSLGDFSGALGYKRMLKNKRVFLASEIKFYYSSKLNDKNMALLFMVGYKL